MSAQTPGSERGGNVKRGQARCGAMAGDVPLSETQAVRHVCPLRTRDHSPAEFSAGLRFRFRGVGARPAGRPHPALRCVILPRLPPRPTPGGPAAGEASRRGRWGRASAGQAAGCSRGAGLPWSAEAPHWPWQLPCGRWAVPGRRWRDPRVPHLVWGWNSEFRARPRPIVLSCLDWVVPSIALGQCSFYFLLPFPLK